LAVSVFIINQLEKNILKVIPMTLFLSAIMVIDVVWIFRTISL